MKKLLILLVAMFGMQLTSFAQSERYGSDSCMVKGGNGESIVVSIEDFTKSGTVYVNIASDCDDYVVVTYTISIYNGDLVGERTYTESVQPNSNTRKKHKIPVSKEPYSAFVDVSGARCEK